MPDDLARRIRNLQAPLESGDIDAVYYEQRLNRLRSEYGTTRVNALLNQHLSERSSGEIAVNIQTDSGSIAGSPVSVVGHAEQVTFSAPPDPTLARAEQALVTYLQRLVGECAALPLGQIDRTDADRARPVELARVYVGLHTTDHVPLSAEEVAALDAYQRRRLARDDKPTRPLTALEALSGLSQGRLMLLGAPGSGKSTFVSHLALCLAGANLCARRPNEPAPADGWLARLPGWSRSSLLPVRLVLRDLAAFAPLAAATHGSLRLLEAFVDTLLEDAGCLAAREPLLGALRDGTALLLLDGFDEVVGDAILTRVVQCINEAAHSYRAPILVTCRVLDYQEEPKRHLSGFPTRTLAELDDAQIAQFVQDWYAGLAASGRRTPAQASERASALQTTISDRGELRALAGSPLLLTVMALVHAFKGRLPDSRAQLYAECVDLLLLRWRQFDDGPDLVRQLGLSELRDTDLRAMMARLGFVAHQKAERSPNDHQPSDLDEDEVIRVLAEEFARYDPQRKRALAEIVFHALAHGNGLLLKRGPTAYAFPHRTFQEFLAGQYLKGQQRDYLRLCRELAPLPHWHEALTLMVGFQVLEDSEIERPMLLAERLLGGGPQEQALAGELLVLVGRERAARYSQDESKRIWPLAITTLRKLATSGRAPAAPATLRARAGLALGQLCYGGVEALSRPTMTAILPDPRLPFAMLGTFFRRHPHWSRCLEQYWCSIQAGPFWSGDDLNERLAPAIIHTPYRIARYPVTNADYARFIAAAGYGEARWWTAQGWEWVRRQQTQAEHDHYTPPFWTLGRYNNPLQPIVTVTWYEAAAYCRWLTIRGHTDGWLPQDELIRLPTWHEWERAARHTDQRHHPWGAAPPDPERANYNDTQLGVPSPVGCFPTGAAVDGPQDMEGNVLEWTASPWEQWDIWQKDFTVRDSITLSWTAFNYDLDQMFCGTRFRFYPDNGYYDQGFRIVQSQALDE